MRALVLRLSRDRRRERVLVTDWPEPGPPAGNQVRTQTLYSGLTNGTDRNMLLGGNYAVPDEYLPCTWGYQNVGRVMEVGPEVQHLRVGDLVYMSADHVEHVVIPEDGLLIKLPPEVDLVHAALFGMGSVAMRACRKAELKPGERVLIVGAGPIGQIAAQIAAPMGARVTLCDVDPSRLDVARQIGAAEEVLNVSGDGWQRRIPDYGFDVVIDLAGVEGMEDRLLAAACRGGRVLFVAGRSRVNYDFNLMQWRELTIRQSAHFDRDDLADLCRLVARGMVRIGPLIRDVVPLADAPGIFETLRSQPNKLLGTVFVW